MTTTYPPQPPVYSAPPPAYYPAPPPAYYPAPAPPKTTHKHRGTLLLIGAVMVAVGIAATAVGGSSGTSNTPSVPSVSVGFNDPDTLAADIQVQMQAKLDAAGTGMTVSTVMCIAQAPHRFICNAEATDGTAVNDTVTVSPDGQTYITD